MALQSLQNVANMWEMWFNGVLDVEFIAMNFEIKWHAPFNECSVQ